MQRVGRSAAISEGDIPDADNSANRLRQSPGSASPPDSISRSWRVRAAVFSSTMLSNWNAIDVACSNPSQPASLEPTHGKRSATAFSPSSLRTSSKQPMRKSRSLDIFSKPCAI